MAAPTVTVTLEDIANATPEELAALRKALGLGESLTERERVEELRQKALAGDRAAFVDWQEARARLPEVRAGIGVAEESAFWRTRAEALAGQERLQAELQRQAAPVAQPWWQRLDTAGPQSWWLANLVGKASAPQARERNQALNYLESIARTSNTPWLSYWTQNRAAAMPRLPQWARQTWLGTEAADWGPVAERQEYTELARQLGAGQLAPGERTRVAQRHLALGSWLGRQPGIPTMGMAERQAAEAEQAAFEQQLPWYVKALQAPGTTSVPSPQFLEQLSPTEREGLRGWWQALGVAPEDVEAEIQRRNPARALASARWTRPWR